MHFEHAFVDELKELPFRHVLDRRQTLDRKITLREHGEILREVDELASDLGRESQETLRMLLRLGLRVAASYRETRRNLTAGR